MTKIELRSLWFQFHKWIGLLLAVLIIPLCVSGAALVWHDALDEAVNPGRYAVTSAKPALAPDVYIESARKVLGGGERIASLRFADGAPAIVTAVVPPEPGASNARPVRKLVWIDPGTARVLDVSRSDAGLVRVLHNLHGNLLVPGVGRTIVGWIGVAMLISSVSGLWLWCPTAGSWVRGLRWRRHRNVDTNLHHMAGFWIALPLFVLSLTGVWISFPGVFGTQGAGAMKERMARMRALPLEQTVQTPAGVIAVAGGGGVAALDWPTDLKPSWNVTLAGKGKPVAVDDTSGAIIANAPKPPAPYPTMRLMRQIHDGTDMGIIWQVIIFLGGVLPTGLAVTGVIMWWRARNWRGDLTARKGVKRAG